MKRFYYHITNKSFWGKKIQLVPRAFGNNRGWDEPRIPRICVSHSIEQCLVAIPIRNYKRLRIYRTVRRIETRRTGKPQNVLDAHITGERWIFNPCTFKLIGFVADDPFYTLTNHYHVLGDGRKSSEKWQRKTIKELRKMKLVK